MKTLTISLLIFVQTTSLCFGQTNIERETKNVKVIRDWNEVDYSSGVKVRYFNYELEVEGEDDDCGNWVLKVAFIHYPHDPLGYARKSGVTSISIGAEYCPYSYIYSAYKADLVIDGNIITSENYKDGRSVEIEKLSDGSYRLTKFVKRTYTGVIIQTYKY